MPRKLLLLSAVAGVRGLVPAPRPRTRRIARHVFDNDEVAAARDDVEAAAARLRDAERRLAEAKRSAPRPRPANARTLIDRSDAGTLLLTVPPAGLGGSTLMGAAFSAAWFSAIVPATAGMVATGAVLGSVFMAPFWLAGGAVLKTTLLDPAKKTTLSIGRYAWELSQTLPGGVAVSSDRGATDELAGADVAVTVVTNGVPQYACRLVAGARAWGLGDGLPRGELEWVASEINDQLSSFAEGEDLLAPPPGRVS